MKQGGASALQPDGASARLWRVLVSLASSPEGDSARRISTSAYSENLVVEFDDAYTNFVDGFDDLPSESQLLALQAVDTKLAAMVGAKDSALWTPDAFRQAPSWRAVRVLAETALGELDWPVALD
jgi:hypothetical protein